MVQLDEDVSRLGHALGLLATGIGNTTMIKFVAAPTRQWKRRVTLP